MTKVSQQMVTSWCHLSCVNVGFMTTKSDQSTTIVHAVLVPGFWLGAWAWEAVTPVVERTAITTHPLTLPGLENPNSDRNGLVLNGHVEAVLNIVSGLDGEVVLVGHNRYRTPPRRYFAFRYQRKR